MELPARTRRPVGRETVRDYVFPERVDSEEKSDQHGSVPESLQEIVWGPWATVAAILLGDAVGALCVFGAMHLATLWLTLETVGQTYTVFAVFIPLLFVAFGLLGFYRPRFVHPALEMKEMVLTIGVMGGSAALTSYYITENTEVVLVVAGAGVLSMLFLPMGRVFARVLFARFSWWGLPAVVVSFGEGGEEIVDTLNRWPELGLRPVAWLGQTTDSGPSDLIRGEPDQAPYLAHEFDIPCVIVSTPEHSHSGRVRLLTHYSKFFDRVFSVSAVDSPVLWTTGGPGEGFRGFGVCNAASKLSAQVLKRSLDLFCATLILVLQAPLLVTIAVLIKIDSDGPVFYRQERLGKGGRIFTLLKFRSMYENADERLTSVLESDPELRREYEKYHKLRDDPRVTRMGEILRKWSLDELPQLLNVIRGDMSLIGPRAYTPAELSDMKGLENVILQTPPGVTGLWQVSGRNKLQFCERVDLDVHYVQNWSLWLDLYLLVRTVPTVLTRHGAA